MSTDTELDLWRRQWQAETAPPADLRRRVERQSRFVRFMFLMDILVTVVIGGGAAAWAIRNPEADVIVLAAAVWLFIAAAWSFAVANRRGTWSPAGLDTAAFLDVSVRRAQASIAATGFGVVLYFAEVLFCLGWIYHYRVSRQESLSPGAFATSPPVLVVWACTLAFLGFVILYRRRKRAELAYLVELRRPVEEDEGGFAS